MTSPAATQRPFRAMVSKELRGNLRWMILGFVIILASLAVAFVDESRQTYPSFIDAMGYYQLLVVLAGLLIGIMSILGEHRGDGYGFLVHRPLTRARIFAGKLTGGLILYLGAAGLPLLLMTAWTAWPGHIAEPFDLRYLRGPLVDILVGGIAFFLGFLCVMREARWYATRWLGVLGAVLVINRVLMARTFPVALGFGVLGLVVAGWAAWGAFATGGGSRTPSRGARIATTITLAGSLLMLNYVVQSSLAWTARAIHEEETVWTGSDRLDSALVVTPLGPVMMVRQYSTLLSGTDTTGASINPSVLLRFTDSVRTESLALEDTPRRRSPGAYRTTDDVYSRFTAASPAGRTRWFYIHRRGLIVGYDFDSARPVAWAGPDGFIAASPVPPRRFDEPLLEADEIALSGGGTGLYLRFRSSVYVVDLANRMTEQRFGAMSGETVIDASSGGDSWLFVTTTRATYTVAPEGGEGVRIERPLPGSATEGALEGIVVQRIRRPQPEPLYVTYLAAMPTGVTLRPEREMLQIGRDGTPVAHYRVPRGRTFEPLPADPAEDLAAALVDPSAPLIGRLWPIGGAPTRSSWFTPLVALLALASAFINALLAKRHGFPLSRLLLWAGIGIVLGPFGIALMAASIDWPACERCPNCTRRRVVADERCGHCAREYPSPPADGTEIFERSLVPTG